MSENEIQNDTVWLQALNDSLFVTRTRMCSLKVPTIASWSHGSCKGPAAPFETMWTQHGSFGTLEVSDVLSEPVRNPDDKKFEYHGGRSSVTLYKQKQNSTALQLLGENSDVATATDVPVGKEQKEPSD